MWELIIGAILVVGVLLGGGRLIYCHAKVYQLRVEMVRKQIQGVKDAWDALPKCPDPPPMPPVKPPPPPETKPVTIDDLIRQVLKNQVAVLRGIGDCNNVVTKAVAADRSDETIELLGYEKNAKATFGPVIPPKDDKGNLEYAVGLLRDALPHIECENASQSGLITAIGEFFERIEENEGEEVLSLQEVGDSACRRADDRYIANQKDVDTDNAKFHRAD